MNKPPRWSYSSISAYESCPAQWKYSYIDQLPWPPSGAAARGTRLHALAEGYLAGQNSTIPYELRYVGRFLEEFSRKQAKPETVWLLDQSWAPVSDSEQAWIKAIIDVHYYDADNRVLHVHDWKTGNPYPDYQRQLELYALIGMQHYPEAERCDYGAIYIDSGVEANSGSIIRQMVEPLRVQWHDRAERMYADEEFHPNPGRACKWCPYSVVKGGPCVAGV